MITVLFAIGAASAASGAAPEYFQPRAKELLADSVELAPNAHHVNVVYFVPSDAEPVAGYERRISELLLYLQQFYGKEMIRNGYGNHSFGLKLKGNGEVDIITIRGKEPHGAYSYNGGWNKSLKEIDAYFSAHPDKKTSSHSFVIMPTFYDGEYNDKNPGGVPFYGLGKNCFALDYADFDIKHLGKDTREGRLLTKWYGGFAHELGHGLNLPHNNGPASMNAALGTPLMGAGNYTFGMSPTYMTPASCAILSNTEVFAPQGDTTEFYTQETPPGIYGSTVACDGETLKIRLELTPDCVLVNAYVQDPPYQINEDYDSVSFVCQMSETAEPDPESGVPQPVRVAEAAIPLRELANLQHAKGGEIEVGLLIQTKEGSRFRWRSRMDLSKPESLKLSKPELQYGY